MTRCAYFGCLRARMESSGGSTYAMCERHTRAYLSAAFAPEPKGPVSWVDRAKAGALPVKDMTRA